MQNPSLSKAITRCKLCDSGDLEPFFSLGDQPLANSLKDLQAAQESLFPLTLQYCGKCSLVQLTTEVSKEKLFSQYVWVTQTSSTAKAFAEIFADLTLKTSGAKPGDFVFEIASNDGTFLKPYIKRGMKVLGLDPAKNICEMANADGVKTLAQFWNTEAAKQVKLEYGSPKLVVARNVIPHVSELGSVMQGIYDVMDEQSVGAIEFHYTGKILKELQYDSIYHEHLCYFSIQSMRALLRKYGMQSFHIDLSPISGGACIIYFSKISSKISRAPTPTREHEELCEIETKSGYNDFSTWKHFAERCHEHREQSQTLIQKYNKRGNCIGFGASARSSTYLNFCKFSYRDMGAIIDNSPLKQGKFTAGSSIPIVSFADGLARKPDLLFLLAWNFTDEILKSCHDKGFRGPALIPFPAPPSIRQV